MIWRDYHERTKHSPESLRQSRRPLDWANMPDPFRHYEGVTLLDLPADPPFPDVPAEELLRGSYGSSHIKDGATFLSQLLFYSAAVSASKRVPSTGYRYALRVNPSSGNLHPTEFHFLTRGLSDWPDGLYHYRPSSHMAEQRARGDFHPKLPLGLGPIVFVLTSIHWREAWKYGNRAYRYCLHDIGHAWEALVLSARAMGCESFATGHFFDDEVARVCGLNDDEWPMLIVSLQGASIPLREPDAGKIVWFGGNANQLSSETITYPLIEGIHSATKLNRDAPGELVIPGPAVAGSGEIKLPFPAVSSRSFGEVSRARRSALNFVGDGSISLPQLSALLSTVVQPFSADFATARFLRLYVYAHRVDGLQPGVYRHWPEAAELEQIRWGDQRIIAAGLSLGQELAGTACIAISMIADLDRATRSRGERGYRYAHFEAGAIGQRLYLAAETLGLGATGIGAFFDEEVHRYLAVKPDHGQVVYHFAIGHPVPDSRLQR